MTLVLDGALQNELTEIQILLGKPYSKLDLFKLLAKEKLAALKRVQSKSSKSIHSSAKQDDLLPHLKDLCVAQPAPNSRYISKAVKREIKIRDQHQCQYVDPISKKQCSSKFHLQFDHLKPFSLGGQSSVENLQMLCSVHNRLNAVRFLGHKK